MNNLQYLGCIAVLGVLASASTAMAQTPTPPIFTPRLGVRYTTEGGGYESFSSFEGFLPVFQTPGNSLTFLQGKVLLDNDSNVATNILLGHRIFSPEGNRVVGGYIAYSTRDTGKSNFNQLGLGFETLGNWDFRFNAYLPLGTSENQVSVINTGSGFQGNSFLLGRQRSFEVAMSGVDAEFGTRLLPLGAGDLRGFVGAYYYSGGESKEAFGWRTRVEARPNDFLNFGLSLQHDELFDTRLVFTIGANFPGSGGRGTKPKKDSALLRMAESSDRQSAILVSNERRNNTVVATGTDNQPLTIIFVTKNGTGNGTFESPLGSITDAVGIAKANNIIYVLADTPTTIAPFTIPDGVQVLSSAPTQTVNTQQFGLVTLPLSGNGIYPVITGSVTAGNGLVTLGNNTVLSGFDIQVQGNDDARGIKGTNISNVRILDNKITNALSEGIYLENATGIVEIARNNLTDIQGTGINIFNETSNNTVSLTTNNNSITNTSGDGINLEGINNAQVINNNITNAGEQGIQLQNANGTINIDSNTITDAQQESISLSEVTGTVSVSQNIVNGNNNNGIAIANTSGTTNLTINSNQLTENFNDIRVSLSGTIGTLQINNNTITNNGTAIDVQLGANTNLTSVSLNNNQITGVDASITSSGINLQAFDNAAAGNVTASGNTINTITNGDGMNFQLNGTSTATFQIATNTISNIRDTDAGDFNFTDGINFEIFDAASSTVQLSNNVIDQIQGYGISVTNFSSGTVNVTISNDNQITNAQDGEVFTAP